VHRFLPHTGEVEVEIEAATAGDVLGEAALALAELMEGGGGDPATREVHVEAGDRAGLLVEWLNELVFRAETEAFVPERITALDLAERSLTASVSGRISAPRELVKAVTYHDLVFEQRAGTWFARIVLDV
jgi:SHS2 domain-containing protein